MDNPRWTIREATAADAAGLQRCMELAYTAYTGRMGGVRLPPMDVDYAQEIASCPVWVALAGTEVIGGLVLLFEPTHATIANVAVHPDHQGSGLGRALMNFAEAEARRRGYAELRLATHVRLTENVSYYERLGWSETGRDEIRVTMRKFLAEQP